MIHGVSWREAFIVVGALCAVAGILIRNSGETARGLGIALVVVGCCLFVLGPAGSILGWW